MNWYLVKNIFQISCANKAKAAQFDEQLRMVMANSETDALYKAREFGNAGESSFLNDRNEKVDWKFIDVADVLKVGEIKDGTEIYSYTHTTEEANTYIKFVQQRADSILEKQLQIAIG